MFDIHDHSLELIPNRLSALVELSSSQWIETFKFIKKNVDTMLKERIKHTHSSFTIGLIATRLVYPKTFKSFCNFCTGPKIDDEIRKIVSNLILLFSDAAYKLYLPCSIGLSESLKTLSHDISVGSNGQPLNFHPIENYAHEFELILRDLSEDEETDLFE